MHGFPPFTKLPFKLFLNWTAKLARGSTTTTMLYVHVRHERGCWERERRWWFLCELFFLGFFWSDWVNELLSRGCKFLENFNSLIKSYFMSLTFLEKFQASMHTRDILLSYTHSFRWFRFFVHVNPISIYFYRTKLYTIHRGEH